MPIDQVKVTLQGNDLAATLPDGRTLIHADPVLLAGLLLANGVSVDQVRMPDWREGDSAPLTGHKVALLAAMRKAPALPSR